MKISTIILSWNRQELLKRTIASWLSTITGDHELYVVDNGSTDGSLDWLRSRVSERNDFKLVEIDKNLGGAAVNSVIPRLTGGLVQFVENDQEFLTGWADYARSVFSAFPNLGQLSLFAPVPTDDEAWVSKPSHLRYSNGVFVYEAHDNCGFSSIQRAELFNSDLKVYNIEAPEQGFRFPDDGRLSKDIKQLGYFCAYSSSYFVINIGHTLDEFERDPEYYTRNYSAKNWVGVDGWELRKSEARQLPKPIRYSRIIVDEKVIPEKTTQPVGLKASRVWSMFDGFTAEVEVVEFIHSLVRLIKPNFAIETGTWRGLTAFAIGSAMRDNDLGHLVSLEFDPSIHRMATENLERMGMTDRVSLLLCPSLEYKCDQKIQFALFDSDIAIRTIEFRHFFDLFDDGAVVCFHDVAPHHRLFASIQELIDEGKIAGINFPSPRGLFVGKVLRN